jgi:hypothetical protein
LARIGVFYNNIQLKRGMSSTNQPKDAMKSLQRPALLGQFQNNQGTNSNQPYKAF